MNNTQQLGNQGENFVANFLQEQGFIIAARNYRQFFGEVDIIAHKKELYVFVEVKTRRSKTIPMEQLISPTKQLKIIKTAQTFIVQEKLYHKILRFDVALLQQMHDNTMNLKYIENAFTAQENQYHAHY